MKEPLSDLATLVLALVLAALARVDTAVGLVASYAGAWMMVNAARVFGWPRTPITVPPRVLAVVVIAVALVPLRDLAPRVRTLLGNEAWAGLDEHVADRRALESDPAIAPALVSSDRPQTYFVRASGAHVRVHFGEGIDWIDAEGMGHGVFRVDYDPRIHGHLAANRHETEATIEVDGQAHARTLLAATPGAHPRWLRLSRDRSRACVPSEETDEVVVVTVDRDEQRIETLDGPSDCLIDDDGTLLVSHRYAREILRVDAAGTRTTIATPGFGAVALTRIGSRICVARETREVFCEGLPPFALEGIPVAMAPLEATSTLVVATRSPAELALVSVSSRGLWSELARRLATPAVALATDAAGLDAFVGLTDLDDYGEPSLGNHFVLDRVARFDPATLALVDDERTAHRTDRQDHAGDVDRGASPMGVSITQTGTRWVAFAGTDDIEEIGGPAPRTIDLYDAGVRAPFSVVALADGSLVVTSPSGGLVVILDESGQLRREILLAPSDAQLYERDREALQLRYGERAFYESTRSGVSCQSCHLHGGTDGARHNIGGRIAAPTLDVRGLLGTSPYLRDGSYPRLRDLHEVAELEYRGYRSFAGDRGATVEAWLRTLPPPPTFEPRQPERERAGLAAFVEARCPTCHAAPAFTSLGMHAVEAVFPNAPSGPSDGRLLDVPSLRSVAVSAPYLYDGRAYDLETALSGQEAQRHGHADALDADRFDALITFLRSL